MTEKEKAAKIQEIHDRAMNKLEELGQKRQAIVQKYIKQLEAQKADTIRASLLSDFK